MSKFEYDKGYRENFQKEGGGGGIRRECLHILKTI